MLSRNRNRDGKTPQHLAQRIGQAAQYIRHNRLTLFWAVAALGLVLPWLPSGEAGGARPQPGDIVRGCEVLSTYDGDTMTVNCAGQEVKVRLRCIDAPEVGQEPWGPKSRDHLRRITPGSVELRVHEYDQYGRAVATVGIGNTNINLQMIREGHAAVYDRYCDDRKYQAVEMKAQQTNRGIWDEDGLHQRPWKWRATR